MTDETEQQQPLPVIDLGERLRKAREQMGLSQREMAEKLCILPAYVIAMEDDNYSYFRASIFAKGYLRSYVRQLGLDEQQAMADYQVLAKQLIENEVELSLGEKFNNKPKRIKLLWLLPSLGLIVAVSWWWLNTAAPNNTELEPAPEVKLHPAEVDALEVNSLLVEQQSKAMSPAAEPVELTELAVEEESIASQAVEEPLVAEAVDEPAAGLLAIEFSADCWIKVVDASGKVLVADLKQAGEQLSLQGIPPYSVVLGYAPAATLHYDGELVEVSKNTRDNSAKLTVGGS